MLAFCRPDHGCFQLPLILSGKGTGDCEMLAYQGRRALVLGGTGFIGRWVVRALQNAGADVCLTARDRQAAGTVSDAYGLKGALHVADLSSDGKVRELIGDLRPAAVFNLAGYGVDRGEREETAAFRINDALLGEIAEALASSRDTDWPGAAVVHTGSALEYGVRSDDLAESSEPRPTTLYGRSKLAGTQRLSELSRGLNLPSVTARLFTIYGPGEHAGRLLPTLLAAAEHSEPIALTNGRQQRDFMYVEDVAEGLLRLGATGTAAGEVVNLATGRLTSVREFIETAARGLGLGEERLRFGALPLRMEEMQHAPVSVSKLRSLLGWVPATSIADGIERTRAFLGRPPGDAAGSSNT